MVWNFRTQGDLSNGGDEIEEYRDQGGYSNMGLDEGTCIEYGNERNLT